MTENDINKDYSCMDDYDPNSILPDEALRRIFDTISAITEAESVPIREALSRVLASNIISEINVPYRTVILQWMVMLLTLKTCPQKGKTL